MNPNELIRNGAGASGGQGEVGRAVVDYCACFNAGAFYEAHEVLELIWLPRRRTTEGELWQGLIQLAAGFVHVQKGRKGPALSLLRTSLGRLRGWKGEVEGLDLASTIDLGEVWEARVQAADSEQLPGMVEADPPRLRTATDR